MPPHSKPFKGWTAAAGMPRSSSGSVLAEACIGLCLMALVWVLMTFMTFMGNNRIRTAMAVRDVVWLQSNGEKVDTVAGGFFTSDNKPVVTVPDPGQTTALNLPGGISSPWSSNANTNTVSFGIKASDLSSTKQFPFTLLNTNLPLVGAPTTTVTGSTAPTSWSLLSVSTPGAWPSDTSNVYAGSTEAGFTFPSF